MTERCSIFYGITSEFWAIACKVIEKMYVSFGERVLFLCETDDEVDLYSSKLWTFSKLSFIPNGNKKTIPIKDAKFCNVWVSTEVEFHNEPTCILHNGLTIHNTSLLGRFNKVVDIFYITEMEEAKARAALYRSLAFDTCKVWLQYDGIWKAGSLL
jgi:DNA polymerase IIIc chi subunit